MFIQRIKGGAEECFIQRGAVGADDDDLFPARGMGAEQRVCEAGAEITCGLSFKL